MRGRGLAVGVRGHGSGEGERPGEMAGAFPLFLVSKAIRGSWDRGISRSAWGTSLRQLGRRVDGQDGLRGVKPGGQGGNV
ncbi:MAG: hypothetical protein HY694_14245 [Deltaproteobacteria bacterium]|nr:hypothetical protein [Deltaproteobacteria bacterium]